MPSEHVTETLKMLKHSAPHTQKMYDMFLRLDEVLNEIADYASEQGIYEYRLPEHPCYKKRHYDEIKKTIEHVREEVHTMHHNWGWHLKNADPDYRNRPEFQLPTRK